MTVQQEFGIPLLSYADVVERLFVEFEGRRSLPAIRTMVHECRAELSCSPEAAMPELLERLARQRLHPAAARTMAPKRPAAATNGAST